MKNIIFLGYMALLLVVSSGQVLANAPEGHRLFEQRLNDVNFPATRDWLIQNEAGDADSIYQKGIIALFHLEGNAKNLLSLVSPEKQARDQYGVESMVFNGLVDDNGQLVRDMPYSDLRNLVFGKGIFAPTMSVQEELELMKDQIVTSNQQVAGELGAVAESTVIAKQAIAKLTSDNLDLKTQNSLTKSSVQYLQEQQQATKAEADKRLSDLTWVVDNNGQALTQAETTIVENTGAIVTAKNRATEMLNDAISTTKKSFEGVNSRLELTWIAFGASLAVVIVGLFVTARKSGKNKKAVASQVDQIEALSNEVKKVSQATVVLDTKVATVVAATKALHSKVDEADVTAKQALKLVVEKLMEDVVFMPHDLTVEEWRNANLPTTFDESEMFTIKCTYNGEAYCIQVWRENQLDKNMVNLNIIAFNDPLNSKRRLISAVKVDNILDVVAKAVVTERAPKGVSLNKLEVA